MTMRDVNRILHKAGFQDLGLLHDVGCGWCINVRVYIYIYICDTPISDPTTVYQLLSHSETAKLEPSRYILLTE